jgi:hypothetical protein
MANSGFTLLWSSMLDSSIWMEDAATRIVWFTLLMMKDDDGMVKTSSAKVIAHKARVTEEEARKALEKFLGPDPDSHLKNDEGKRVREVNGCLQIINHEQYRFSTDAKRLFWRHQKEEKKKREARKIELAKQGRLREPPKPKPARNAPSMAERLEEGQ